LAQAILAQGRFNSSSHLRCSFLRPSMAMAGRPALISARFDGGEVETRMRDAFRILKSRNLNVLMVEAMAGDDFGKMTALYLNRVRRDEGVILAVCTEHYAEITSSRFSSFEELRYAYAYGIDIIPLKMAATYPPQPGYGPEHAFDKEGLGQALLAMAMPPSLLYEDCISASSVQIADKIAARLSTPRVKSLLPPAVHVDTFGAGVYDSMVAQTAEAAPTPAPGSFASASVEESRGSAASRIYRFRPLKLRCSPAPLVAEPALVQVACFGFVRGGELLSLAGATVTYGSGAHPSHAGQNAASTDPDTKWLDVDFRNEKCWWQVCLPEPVVVDGFRYLTGNDLPSRDPVSWTLEVAADDSGHFEKVQQVANASIPQARGCWTDTYPLGRCDPCEDPEAAHACRWRSLQDDFKHFHGFDHKGFTEKTLQHFRQVAATRGLGTVHVLVLWNGQNSRVEDGKPFCKGIEAPAALGTVGFHVYAGLDPFTVIHHPISWPTSLAVGPLKASEGAEESTFKRDDQQWVRVVFK